MAEKMIRQMGADTGRGEVESIDKGWPPKAAPRGMIKQMGEDAGDIEALMNGGHYDPSSLSGEGKDVTPNEKSMYQGDKKPRVAGGTYGFDSVPKVGEPVTPYPTVDDVLFERENVHNGFWAKDVVGVTVTPGNSKVVGDMATGMPKDGEFSGPAKIGPGDMVSDYEPSEARESGAEDTFEADLVGDLVTGMPTDDYPRDQDMRADVSPEGLVTGDTEGGYAPGVNQPVSHERGNEPTVERPAKEK